MARYILNHSWRDKLTGQEYPYLNASTVKSKDEFFKPKNYPAENYRNKFYEQEREFNYMIPQYFTEGMENVEPDVICDLHKWVVKYPRGGKFLPVSQRFKELLEQFNLTPSKFYQGKVLFKGEYHPYYVWLILANAYENFINFDKSTFCEWSFTQKKKLNIQEKKINSVNELEKLVDAETWDYWGFNRAVMKPAFKENDCCWFPILGYVISERLKNAIEKAGLTGVEIKECPVEFEYSD